MPRLGKTLSAVFLATLFLSPAQALPPTQGAWTATGNLNSNRQFAAEVLMSGGKVLVAGGTDGTNILATTETYDPSAGKWMNGSTMALGRKAFPAVALNNGKVLVAGGLGSNGTVLASSELYDPASATWTSVGTLSVGRFNHTATLLENGRVLASGGCTTSDCGSITGVSELFDPNTNRWSTTGRLATARFDQTASLLANGKVLVVGGSNGHALSSVELYNPSTGTWGTVPSTKYPRFLHAATVLTDGTVLVTGGNPFRYALSLAEVYDPSTNSWTATGSMTTGRFAHTSTLLGDGTVLIAGGGVFRGCGRVTCAYPSQTAEIYNQATGRFTATGSMSTARWYHTAALLGTGRVLADQGTATPIAELYTPLSLKFSRSSLDFGFLQLGLTSPTQTVTVTNVSNHPVTFTSITATGDFHRMTDCPGTLNVNKSCSIKVDFRPTATGARNGAVVLKDNSIGSPEQMIALSGVGEKSAVSFTKGSLDLGNVVPGNSSPPMNATLINDSAASVNISVLGISPNDGTFTQKNGCPGSLQPQQTCVFQIVFTPPDAGSFTATLSVSDSGTGGPAQLTLSGTGLD